MAFFKTSPIHTLRKSEAFLLFVSILVPLIYWGPCATGNDICFNDAGWADYRLHYSAINSYLNSSHWIPAYQFAFTWPSKSSLLYADAYPLVSILLWPLYKLFKFPAGIIFPALSVANSVCISLCIIALRRHFSLSIQQIVLLSFFLLTSPVSWWRLFHGHESLQLHSLVILPLTLMILRVSSRSLWVVVLAIITGINPYYLPFAFLGYLLTTLFTNSIRKPLLKSLDLIVALITCTIVLFICGYIPGYASQMPHIWGANMLSLLNPQGTSTILSPIQISSPYETEGYSYLGIAGTILATFFLFRASSETSSNLRLPAYLPILCITFLVISWGLTWNISTTPVTEPYLILGVHKPMVYIYGIFRSAGRFTWPVYYLIFIWSIVNLRSFKSYAFASFLIAIQLFELVAPMASRIRGSYSNKIFLGVNPSQVWAQKNSHVASLIRQSQYFLVSDPKSLQQTLLPPPYTPQMLNPSIAANWGGVNLSRRPSTEHHFIQQLKLIPKGARATVFTGNLQDNVLAYIRANFTLDDSSMGYLLITKT